MNEIERSFRGFMEMTMPLIPKNGVEWFAAKLAFVAGHVMTLGVPDNPETNQLADRVFEESRLHLYFANFKQEYIDALPLGCVLVGPEGERLITETGVVHLFTMAEQSEPHHAEELRRARYQVQAAMRRLKTL